MPFVAMYALHKDANDKIVDAGAFDYSFKLNDWLKSLDVHPGDKIEFGEKAAREQPVAEPLSIVASA